MLLVKARVVREFPNAFQHDNFHQFFSLIICPFFVAGDVSIRVYANLRIRTGGFVRRIYEEK